jgi:ribosomal protein S18 acetylase RimI-like enzyme
MDSLIPGAEIRIAEEEDLWLVRELADQIFPVTYQDIVKARQIEYMMDLFYSPEALVNQLDAGQIFLLLYYEENPVGYASYTPLQGAEDFKLNKIYIDNRIQGKGLGKYLLFDIISRVKAGGGLNLQLNVNRNNTAVGFYENMGFSIMKEELLDIGGGHFMDDYVMELCLEPKA